MAEPPITRNFALFLASLAAILLALPFADRNDWQGWAATLTMIAAATWIVGVHLWFLARMLRDWWRGYDLD